MTPNFTQKLINFINSKNAKISNISLLIAGNVISGSEIYTVNLLKGGLFKILREFLRQNVHLEHTWWCIENMTAGNSNNFYFIISDVEIMQILAQSVRAPCDHAVRHYATKSLVNIFLNSSEPIILQLLQKFEFFEILIKSLNYPDTQMVQNILSAVNRIFNIFEKSAESLDILVEKFECSEGVEMLDKISNDCENETVAAFAANLLEKFQSSMS